MEKVALGDYFIPTHAEGRGLAVEMVLAVMVPETQGGNVKCHVVQVAQSVFWGSFPSDI